MRETHRETRKHIDIHTQGHTHTYSPTYPRTAAGAVVVLEVLPGQGVCKAAVPLAQLQLPYSSVALCCVVLCCVVLCWIWSFVVEGAVAGVGGLGGLVRERSKRCEKQNKKHASLM